MDISKIELGEIIPDLKCPKCKGLMKLVGMYHKREKSYELECQTDFYTEYVNPKDVKFTYIKPEKKKEKKDENEE